MPAGRTFSAILTALGVGVLLLAPSLEREFLREHLWALEHLTDLPLAIRALLAVGLVLLALPAAGARLVTTIGRSPNLGDQSPASCLLYTSPSPRDGATSRMPSSA